MYPILGKAPDTFIAVGTTPDITESTVNLINYPNPNKLTPLTKFDGSDSLVINLPENINTKSIKWISVWNKPTSTSLGEVIFSENLVNVESNKGSAVGESGLDQGYVKPKKTIVPGLVTPIHINQPDETGILLILNVFVNFVALYFAMIETHVQSEKI